MKQGNAMTDVEIEVTPLMVQDGLAICEVKPGANSTGKVTGGVIRLKKSEGPFKLRFKIVDTHKTGLTFNLDADEAFWCNAKACPQTKMNNSKGQLSQATVDPDGLSIHVIDTPGNHRNAIHYSLGFSDGSRLDPVIIHDYL